MEMNKNKNNINISIKLNIKHLILIIDLLSTCLNVEVHTHIGLRD